MNCTKLTLAFPQIYAERTQSEARRNQELPPPSTEAPRVGAVFSPPMQETQIIPEIAPMRRGRPSKPSSQQNSAHPSPSPYRARSSNDPFAALDNNKRDSQNADEIAARFPTLDQFSLLHEKGGKFEFEPAAEKKTEADDLSQRVTNALADDAFVKPASPYLPAKEEIESHRAVSASVAEQAQKRQSPSLKAEELSSRRSSSQRPTMVSTGTMTESPPPAPSENRASISRPSSSRPIYKFPPPSQDRQQPERPWASEIDRPSSGLGTVPSQTTTIHVVEPKSRVSSEDISRAQSSARPSLEASRPSFRELGDGLNRPKSANSRVRPSSVHLGGRYDPTSSRDSPLRSPALDTRRPDYEGGEPLKHARTDGDYDAERGNITSDVDYLRAREEEEAARKKEKRLSGGSKHVKRSSLSSLAISGKGLLAGRFGDAFRRFEQNTSDNKSRTPSPSEVDKQLTPIAGSEATDDRSDDDALGSEATDISPEMRRELERRRLSQEEKRVANAAAEYRLRVAGRGAGGREGTKSPAIQNKVQSLLQDNSRPAPKTASGYGKYTNSESEAAQASESDREYVPRLPTRPKPPPKDIRGTPALSKINSPGSSTQPTKPSPVETIPSQRTAQRPAAPPKPKKLQTGGSRPDERDPPSSSAGVDPTSPTEDWERNFSRRYPSLSGLEMVETEIDVPKLSSIRTREV